MHKSQNEKGIIWPLSQHREPFTQISFKIIIREGGGRDGEKNTLKMCSGNSSGLIFNLITSGFQIF